MQKKKGKIGVEIVFTPGYEERFTEGILKIFAERERKKIISKNKESEVAV